jgi:hypothetical protein
MSRDGNHRLLLTRLRLYNLDEILGMLYCFHMNSFSFLLFVQTKAIGVMEVRIITSV